MQIDLNQVAAVDRSRFWRQTIKTNYFDADIRFPCDLYPAGKIVRSQVGSITVSAFASVAQTHDRTSIEMSDDVDHLFGLVQLCGRTRIAQNGRETDLSAGCLVVLDSAQPLYLDFLDEHQTLCLKIPRTYFAHALMSEKEFVNIGIDERNGSMVIADYFRGIARDFNHLPFKQRERMSAHGVRLMVDTALGVAKARETSPSTSP